jgi:hypothetical protein
VAESVLVRHQLLVLNRRRHRVPNRSFAFFAVPSTLSADLVDPAPGSPLRRTRPSRHQTIQTKAHCQNDPATPKPRLSDRTTGPSKRQSGTSAVIFDPGIPPFPGHDGVDEGLVRSLLAGPPPALGRKQHAALSFS